MIDIRAKRGKATNKGKTRGASRGWKVKGPFYDLTERAELGNLISGKQPKKGPSE